jgi:hypothetical protein
MKKSIWVILTTLLIMLTSIFFVSCKKDPTEVAKSDIFKQLKGTWALSDYTSTVNSGWNVSGDYDYNSRYSTFSENIVTCMNVHSAQSWPGSPTCDTVIDTFRYIKHMGFTKYKKNVIYYNESTIQSSNSSYREYYMDWTNLTIDNLSIRLGDKDCGIMIDSLDNLIISCKTDGHSMAGSWYTDTKWIFRKE